MAEVNDTGSTDGVTQLSVTGDQFETMLSTVVAAVRQTTAPLDPSQQAVALKFRLLRNGLGRFQSPSEGYDRSLIRMHQVRYGGQSELVIDDPVPRDAYSMVLVVGSQRRSPQPVTVIRNKRCVYKDDDGSAYEVIELVEFLDRFDVPIAAGVPVQLADYDNDQRTGVGGAETVAPVD